MESKYSAIDPSIQKKILLYFNCLSIPNDILNILAIKDVLKEHLPIQKRLKKELSEKLGKRVIEARKKLPNDQFRSLYDLQNYADISPGLLEDLSIFWKPPYCKPCRNIYLKIEEIEDYSPVDPQDEKPLFPIKYRRDCLRLPGHEDTIIQEDEVVARAVDAVVFREYEDADYLFPKTYKLINADINEPIYDRRIPGSILYAHPGERLCIHVFNDHNQPHSFHIHGLKYGPDSDGTYPLGVQSSDGRRSDEICPKQYWKYVFDVTEEMVGCWPFHSHYRNSSKTIELGLFGGLVVLPKGMKPPEEIPLPKDYLVNNRLDIEKVFGKKLSLAEVKNPVFYKQFRENLHERFLGDWAIPKFKEKQHHVPVFLHFISSDKTLPLFTSGDMEENTGVFEHIFDATGDFDYFCEYHPGMTGTVQVVSGAPAFRTVNIEDSPDMGFYPEVIDVAPGGTVRWENHSSQHHTVTSAEGANIPTHCLNGRGFLGNTPTVEAFTGEKIRWYIFNLDIRHEWHNFHVHNARWSVAGEAIDVRSLGPAESFCFETEVPCVVLMDKKIEDLQDPEKRPENAKKYTFYGEFPFHCHVHHHFMNGMVGMIRAKHVLWLTPSLACDLMRERGLKLYNGKNDCPKVDLKRCKKQGGGTWEDVPGDPRVAMMHACLLPQSSKLLYFGYETRYSPLEHEYSWLWDPNAGYHMTANQVDDITPGGYTQWSLWSGEHTFLNDNDGTILIHGGYRDNLKKAYLFNSTTETWSTTAPTQEGRFYSTTITLADGKAMTLFGSNLGLGGGNSTSIEIYDPATGTWSAPQPFPMPDFDDHQYYPWTFLLPDGELFIAGPHVPTHRFDPNNPAVNEQFSTVHGDRSSSGEKGTAVMLTLRPPDYAVKVVIIGGNIGSTPGTSEIIDLSQPAPAWSSPAYLDLNEDRSQQCHSVILPDGKVFLCGGISGADGGPCEILDPNNLTGGWQRGPVMKYARTYHSAAILMADGSVIAGGDPNGSGGVPTPHEQFKPYYFNLIRPDIVNAPAQVDYDNAFVIDTPQGSSIGEVVLMKPGAVTHGWNMTQRRIELVINSQDATSVNVQSPPNGFVAPPGWYLIFILDTDRIPSEGRWIRLTS
ncbi:DUF1929 domain-containing protein [Mangrovivirga sp. M17]|uniref:DUF1929 domain-containing protein n=1 Tax=Mangrovivirga halotolerans TaxID=2993936 RepID=A0ABT3RUH6_9BACT|nr:galactose oxidase-like domain-containing protein [Mangrovivirga halotolerans]MCX2745433.1 DUF1929 domain-containing protein [Mangrovivirga halotolerans]